MNPEWLRHKQAYERWKMKVAYLKAMGAGERHVKAKQALDLCGIKGEVMTKTLMLQGSN